MDHGAKHQGLAGWRRVLTPRSQAEQGPMGSGAQGQNPPRPRTGSRPTCSERLAPPGSPFLPAAPALNLTRLAEAGGCCGHSEGKRKGAPSGPEPVSGSARVSGI